MRRRDLRQQAIRHLEEKIRLYQEALRVLANSHYKKGDYIGEDK